MGDPEPGEELEAQSHNILSGQEGGLKDRLLSSICAAKEQTHEKENPPSESRLGRFLVGFLKHLPG